MADIAPLDVVVDVHVDPEDREGRLAEETWVGLAADQPWIPPVWFYDDVGSALFEDITRLPEYYPTRAELEILETHAAEIAVTTAPTTLMELGSGTSEKTRVLIDALRSAGCLDRFVPFDVSEATLRAAAESIAEEHPGLAVHAVVGDFHRHIPDLPDGPSRMLAFLGSTIGNFDPDQRRRFYFDVDAELAHGDWLLLGTDLVKEPERLLAAYNDSEGVTAEFNRNALRVLGRELGLKSKPEAFRHAAHWDDVNNRIEMRLVADSDQVLRLPRFDNLEVRIDEGEWLRTEISSKFTPEVVHDELWEAGLAIEEQWTDEAGDYLLTLARPYC